MEFQLNGLKVRYRANFANRHCGSFISALGREAVAARAPDLGWRNIEKSCSNGP